MHRLLEAVEAAKKRLSSAPSTSIDLPFWDGQRSLTLDLTRLQFEKATADLRTRLWPPLEQMGRQAFVEWAHRWHSDLLSCIRYMCAGCLIQCGCF